MSLWTCVACAARRAVGMDVCPQCGAAAHDEGDTISGSDGAQGQRHIPEAYVQPVDAAPPAPQPVVLAQTDPGATLTVIPELPADTPPPEPSTP